MLFRDKAGNFSVVKLVSAIAAVLVVLLLAGGCFTVIPAGHTGVVLTFGKVADTALQEGLHFKTPFVQNIVTVDNRIVKLEVRTEAFSKDLQTITTVVAVNYRVSKDMSQSIYKEIGMDFENVLIVPAVNEVLKAVTARYTAVELVGSRADVSILLNEDLNTKLNSYGIYINELNIINWDFSEEYVAAIEAKQVAEQNLIKTKTEQEQELVIANTAAEKRVIAAEAEAKEIKTLAEATAESNRIITESLTDKLLEYRTIEAWNGELPMVMSGESTLVSLPLNGIVGTPAE